MPPSDVPIVDLFMRLVALPSPSGRERAVATFIEEWLAAEGVGAELDGTGTLNDSDAGNLVAVVPGGIESPRCLFVAHMDTVETGATAIRPVLAEDGVIRSAGDTILGADNKSGVAAVMRLCRAVARLPEERRPTVIAAFTSREESGRMGASLLDLDGLGVDCAFCVDGSKPVGAVTTRALGQRVFEIAVRGRAAHAAVDPGAGVNAIGVAAEIVAALPLGRQPGGGSLNVAAIVGGAVVDRLAAAARTSPAGPAEELVLGALAATPTNSVPDAAFIRGEARAYTAEALDSTMATIEKAAAEACESHGAAWSWLRGPGGGVPPFPGADASRARELVEAAAARVPDVAVVCEESPATLEANYLAQACDAVAISSGGRHPHEPSECISVRELEQLETLLVEIVRLAAEPGAS